MRTLVAILVLALIAAIATVIFALGNPGIVSVHFLKWSFDSSLTLLMLAPFALGLILGWLFGILTAIRRRLTVAASQKRTGDYQGRLEHWNQSKANPSDSHPVTLP